MQILLAEDNEANRILVRSLLEREGHVLDFAPNGSIALMCCEDKKYDLILMDILMPVMDGVKTLRRLRRSGNQNAQTPVFALTGYTSPSDKRRYSQAGFDIVMTKPLRPNDLARAWNSFLKGDHSVEPHSCDNISEDFEAIPWIDNEVIGQLLISGTRDEIENIIENYWSSTRVLMTAIDKNLSLAMNGKNDALSELRKSAHGIKGSAATIGLLRLSRIAATLQNAPPEKIKNLILALAKALKPSAEALTRCVHEDLENVNTGSVATHFGDANAPIRPVQSLSSPSELQCHHRISEEAAPRRRARVP